MSGLAPPLSLLSRNGCIAWSAAALWGAIVLVPLMAVWTQAQDLGHGWAVPVLVAYLWWERWEQRPSGIARDHLSVRWWLGAILLAVLALPFRLLLTPFPLWPAAVMGYVAVLVAVALGGAWLAAGRAGLRWVGGPLILLLGAVPWPSTFEFRVVGPMREMLAATAAEVSYVFGVSALAAGTTVRLAHIWVGVDETCGGMRSLQASVMAALFFGEWLRLGWRRRAGLVAVGIAAALLGNFLRILLLVWRAGVGGEAALAAVHDLAGWFALAASLGATGFVAWRLRDAATSAINSPIAQRGRAALPRAALAWIVALAAALGLIELGARWWFWRGAALQAAAVAQWSVRFPASAPNFRVVPLGESAREMLRPDSYAAAEWQDDHQRPIGAYSVEWRHGQAARSMPFLHNPTICLPMAGCELVRPIGIVPVRWAGGVVPFRAYLFRRIGQEFAVGFVIWDPSRGRPLENDYVGWRGWMVTRFQDVAEARADQPAQMLAVAVWGEHPEDRLAANIEALIISR